MPRTPVPLLATALLAIALAATPRHALAAWPLTPAVNVPVCTATSDQSYPTIASDGAGGAIITWYDLRSGTNYHIYTQRISAGGTAQWTSNGVPICIAGGNSTNPRIIPDNAGGAIITWEDRRSSTTANIYAQRISATGAIQWPTNGVAVCTAGGIQEDPDIIADGTGGAIVVWHDLRAGDNYDIYAQRISAAGAVQWTADGVALCTAAGNQKNPVIASDDAGGAIVAWTDYRNSENEFDVFAQRIPASGTVQWTANGVALCTALNNQTATSIVPDGEGGAIVAWTDYRSGTAGAYARRISASGIAQWNANGVAVSTVAGSQWTPQMASDGAGGAILAWPNYHGSADCDTYAQRVSSGGAPLWGAEGVELRTSTGSLAVTPIVADDEGGAIVGWQDIRSGSTNVDLYAQRVSATGTPRWTAGGVAISTATKNQSYPTLASDGAGGAIVTWQDLRDITGNADIFAQYVDGSGGLGHCEAPQFQSVKDVPEDEGGQVLVSWPASCLDASPAFRIGDYTLWRRVTAMAARQALAHGAALTQGSGPGRGSPRAGAIRTSAEGTATSYWELIESVPANGASGYARTVTTAADSISGLVPYDVFMVDANEADHSAFYSSELDSGYSVDNLAPATPAPFTGEYRNGTTTLHWPVNPAADLVEYRLYRGATAGFVPGPGTLLAAQPDTGYTDEAGAILYYKLCALDVHGNLSGFSTVLPAGVLATPGASLPRAVFLAPPAPNPAHGATTLRFGLPREARVELALYDQQGRRVHSLLSGSQPAGEWTIAWNGCDESGRALPAGLYFVRLASEGRTFVSRLAVIR